MINRLLLLFFSLLVLSPTVLFSNPVIGAYGEMPLRGEVWYGNASWYGHRFQGKKTSNGEKFNKNKLTAAHKFLPFNTKVLVTNLQNNKSVVVRINDRGPFKTGRIIDLSEKAADKIGTKKEGISYIRLQVLTPASENNS